VGLDAVTRCYVEREPFGAACLAAAIERGELAPAALYLGDVREFPAAEWRGAVDLVCGGFPCQDISAAGKGAGIHGARSSLFFDLLAVADEVGARYLCVENVAAIATRGLGDVLGALAEGGWDAEWGMLKASDVGAPHRRERWFCLAYRKRPRRRQVEQPDTGPRPSGEPERARGELADAQRPRRPATGLGRDFHPRQQPQAGSRGGLPAWPPRPDDAEGWRRVLAVRPDLAPALAHAGHGTREEHEGRDSGQLRAPDGRRGDDAARPDLAPALADAERRRHGGHEGDAGRDEERGVTTQGAGPALDVADSHSGERRPDGGGTDTGTNRGLDARGCRAAAFGDQASPQPEVRLVDDGALSDVDRALAWRTDRLRALGNAVVPAQGAAAFALLWERLHR